MHMIRKTLPTYEDNYREDFATQFERPLELVAYTYFVDPQYGPDSFGIKIYVIKTNWSTKILTINLLIKLKVTT